MKAIIIFSLFMAGCAIQPMELARMSDVSVCNLAASGGPETSQNARHEAERRKQNCAAK